MNPEIIDFPKIKSPFVRETINGKYVVTPKFQEGYEWILEPQVRAVDKLHGTNIAVHMSNGEIIAIDNRDTRIFSKPINLVGKQDVHKTRILFGMLNCMSKKWLDGLKDGIHYGELIAPEINGNLHETTIPMFVPFDYLYRKCYWISWSKGEYPKTFDSLNEWFKTLPSLFSKRVGGKEVLAEGLIFTHPDGRMAKLRRDMFDWYEGPKHKADENTGSFEPAPATEE